MYLLSTLLVAALLRTAKAQQCSPLHLISTRASLEGPQGINTSDARAWEAASARANGKGFGRIGFQLFNNLKQLIPGTTGRATPYPAAVSGDGCKSENPGVADIIAQISARSKACPSQKYVLTGLSQGGVVTVRAIKEMPKELLPRILAVTMFMSPNCPPAVRDRCKSYCNNDIICTGDGGGRAGGRCNNPLAPTRLVSEHLDAGLDIYTPGEILSLSSPGDDNVLLQQPNQAAVAQCSGPPPPDRGKQATGYSFYAKAAACYIYKRFNESKANCQYNVSLK